MEAIVSDPVERHGVALLPHAVRHYNKNKNHSVLGNKLC